ncbi:MAG: alpha-mannosidase, partial [Clostridiales bacterium]|nr:alpha-mannosidase [Clostridiales bacterium]
MAHIKVERRSMRAEEWTALRFGWLKRHVYRVRHEIDTLQIRDARQTDELVYDYDEAGYRPLQKGDMYFTPDGTAFIRAEVKIPFEIQGGERWLQLKTAAEMVVKVNGAYAGGIDPNRERVLLTPFLGRDDFSFKLEIEGYNRSKPDDERNPESLSVRGCRQVFEGAYLAVVDHAVQELVYDFELLLDMAGSELFPEDYRSFLNLHLGRARDCIDFDTMEGVAEARQDI